MPKKKYLGRRAAASTLSVTMIFSTAPPVAARDVVLGTVNAVGSAFAATATTDWAPIKGTRPLVAGDRLKTEHGASLVADFSQRGIVGLYPESEVSVLEHGSDILVQAQRGRVAFHLAPNSNLKLGAGTSTVAAGGEKAEGYIEYNDRGAPELVVESANLTVTPATGPVKVVARGERMLLSSPQAEVIAAPAPDERKAAAMPESGKRKGLSPLTWTAIGVVVAAVGIGAGIGAAGGGGGGGDSNGSE
jgi:hypothetical protein